MTDSHETLTGGCQCGTIRYQIAQPAGEAIACHSRMCQKAFGSWGAVLVQAPASSLTWTRGNPSVFRSSSIVARGFCKSCGTPLFMHEDGDENYELAVGTLDDPAAVSVVRQSGIESRLPWFSKLHTLPQEATADYRSSEDLEKLKSLQHPDYDTAEWPPK